VAAAADHYQEGIRLARNLENTAPLVSLLIQATVTYLAQTELALARQMIEEAAPLAQNLGLNHYSSDVSVAFGRLAILEGRPAEALPHFQRAVQITEGDGDQQGLGFALINLGRAEMALANYATAEAHFERAGQILSRIGNRRGIGLVQLYQAELETLVAPKTAGPMIKVALSAIHALKLHFPSLMLIAMSVRVYYALGQLETVAQVLGFLAPHSTGDIQKLIEPGASQAEQSLGPEVWQQAQNQGQGLLMEQVIERILGDFAV
jgi:tetratricopeptide (TPR) repeat protein